jgi:RNA polymerase sigma-70 factor, ECF subfamily
VATRDEDRDLAAAQAGDERAFGRMASRHRPGLELFCQLMLGCPHQAHHAVGETLLRGWEGLHRGAPPATVRIWLYRLATDVCLEVIDASDESGHPPSFDGQRDRNEPPR